MRILPLSTAFALILAGCSQDPKEAGFFGGIYNAATGAYDERQEALRAEAEAAEARRDRLFQRTRQIQDELSSLEPEQRALSQELVRLDQELAIQSRELDQVRVTNQTQADALARLRAQERELTERQLSTDATDQDAAAEIAELERENERLGDEIAAFLESLGGS